MTNAASRARVADGMDLRFFKCSQHGPPNSGADALSERLRSGCTVVRLIGYPPSAVQCVGLSMVYAIALTLFASCSDPAERLRVGIESGRVDIVREALKAGASPNRIIAQVSGISSGEPETRRCAALHEAAERGDLAIVNELLAYSADPDIEDGLHQTPLMRAARHGRADVALCLIRVSRRFDAEDSMHRTALDWAAGYGDVSTLLAVLIGRPDSDRSWSLTHLQSARRVSEFRNDYQRHFIRALLVEYAMDSGASLRSSVADRDWSHDLASIGATDRKSLAGTWTSLMWNASSLGSDAGFGLDMSTAPGAARDVSDEGWTPLHSAVESGSVLRVRILIDQGVDVNASDDRGLTPLMLACLLGNDAVESELRRLGASTLLRDAFGRTHEDFARHRALRD